MADKPENVKSVERPVTGSSRSPDYKNLYINATRMSISPWDIRIAVGQVVEIDGKNTNEDAATIVMSPQHAKAFLASLQKSFDLYEERFGKVAEANVELEPESEVIKPTRKIKLRRTH